MAHRGRLFFAVIVLALANFGLAPTAAAKRVALVIGNDRYENVANLEKAVNDAQAIGSTLADLGFDVAVAENISRRQLNAQLQAFTAKIKPGDEALFFYAGHGLQIEGRNFLLPTDIPAAKPGQEVFIQAEAVSVDRVLDAIRSRGSRVAILVLDACRNNPFPRKGTRSLGGTRGLASMPAPEGTFIMYSAGVGQEALDRLGDDDKNPNSIFTRTLIPLLKTPGLKLTETARQVRREVEKIAANVPHEQRPAYYDEVTGEFFFTPADNAGTAEEAKPTAGGTVDNALAAWNLVRDSDDVDLLEAFRKQYGKDNPFLEQLVARRIGELHGRQARLQVEPRAPAVAPQTRDVKLQRQPEWQIVKAEFPDFYEQQLKEVERLNAQSEPESAITKHLATALVQLRRKHSADGLAASPAKLVELAQAFLENLQGLSRQGTQQCYAFISQGETAPAILPLLESPDQGATVHRQLAVTFDAIAEGRKRPTTYAKPIKSDYEELVRRLTTLGWKQADLETFADAKKLAGEPPERVCAMIQDWFKAHLSIEDGDIQNRLLVETLKPVISG